MSKVKLPNSKNLPRDLFSPIRMEKIIFPTFEDFIQSEKEADSKVNSQILANKLLIFNQRMEKLISLGNHFGLDKNDPNFWLLLCFYMGNYFVPGFQVQESVARNRKKVWDNQLMILLWYNVREKMKGGKSALGACSILIKQSPWKDLLKPITVKNGQKVYNPQALYTHYKRARNLPFIKLITKLEKQAKGKTFFEAVLQEIPLMTSEKLGRK